MNKPIREGFVAEEVVDVEATLPGQAAPLESAAQETSPLLNEVWPIKVRLVHKPIRDAKGNEIKELVFRQPTGGDINRNGLPVRIDGGGDVVIDPQKMTLMMTALTGVMTPFLEQMDPRDWASCAYRLRGFFLPELAAW